MFKQVRSGSRTSADRNGSVLRSPLMAAVLRLGYPNARIPFYTVDIDPQGQPMGQFQVILVMLVTA